MRVFNKMKKEAGAALCEYLLLSVSVVVIGIPAISAVGNSSKTTLDKVFVEMGGESNGSSEETQALASKIQLTPTDPSAIQK